MKTLTIGEFLQLTELLHRMPPDRILTIVTREPSWSEAVQVETFGTTVVRDGKTHLTTTLVLNKTHSEVLIP